MPNLHDARRILVGERSQQHGVHHGENRGVGADTQCEEEDSRSREAWITSENPEAMAQIRDQVTHEFAPHGRQELGNWRVIEYKRTKRPKCFPKYSSGGRFNGRYGGRNSGL